MADVKFSQFIDAPILNGSEQLVDYAGTDNFRVDVDVLANFIDNLQPLELLDSNGLSGIDTFKIFDGSAADTKKTSIGQIKSYITKFVLAAKYPIEPPDYIQFYSNDVLKTITFNDFVNSIAEISHTLTKYYPGVNPALLLSASNLAIVFFSPILLAVNPAKNSRVNL